LPTTNLKESFQLVSIYILVYGWTLADWRYPQNGYLSAKGMLKIDCALERFTVVSMINYVENMGKGAPYRTQYRR